MKYTKVMLRVFSQASEDLGFKKSFSDAIEEAQSNGSSEIKNDDTDINLDKKGDGSIEVTDNSNGEVTVAKENPSDKEDMVLEKKESDEPEDEDHPSDDEPKEDEDAAKVSEVEPDKEYKIETKNNSFSVKGDLRVALKVAKLFSSKVDIDLTKVDHSNMEPEKDVPASIGIIDGKKAGTPANRSFSEVLEDAKKAAEEDPEGSIINTDNAQYHVKKECDSNKFSFAKFDPDTRTYAEIPEDDIVAEVEGTNIEPAKDMPADKGVKDPDKTGMPEERKSFSEVLDDAKEAAKDNEEGSMINTKECSYHITYKEGKFSFTKINLDSKTFADTNEDEMISEQESSKDNEEKPKEIKEVVDDAKEAAKEDPEGSMINTKECSYHITYKEGKFSFTKIDLNSKTFSDITEDEIVNEQDPSKQAEELEKAANKEDEEPTQDNAQELSKEETEKMSKSFSACLEVGSPYKVFATSDEVKDAQDKLFSNQGSSNPFLTTDF